MKCLAVCLFVFCLRVAGQSPNGEGTAPEPAPAPVPAAYDVRISFYTWPVRGVMHGGMEIPSIPPVVMRSDTGTMVLPLQRNAQTEAYRYVGRNPPVLVTPTSMTIDEEGNRQYKFEKVADLNIPRGLNQVVVLLFPEERNAQGRWRHIIVPASNVLVPDGKLRVVNTTDQGLVLEINENYQVIAPLGSLLVDPATDAATGRGTRFRLRLHGKDDMERARLLHTSVYRSNQERGNLLIAYEENGRVRALKLENHEPPPTPTPMPAE